MRSGPEALGSASGCSVPSRQCLLWPHPSFWRHSGRLMVFAGRSLPRGRGPEGPCFQLANPSVRAAFRTPADRTAQDDCTSARDSLRPNARGSASATSHLNRYAWVPLRGCEVRLMLRPEQLLALHRQGRLRSSFHSHESPHQNVEHDYAGKSSISRDRTHTGWIRSLAGCTTFGAVSRRAPAQVVSTARAPPGSHPAALAKPARKSQGGPKPSNREHPGNCVYGPSRTRRKEGRKRGTRSYDDGEAESPP